LVCKLDRSGRSLVGCLNNTEILEDNGIRFIAVTRVGENVYSRSGKNLPMRRPKRIFNQERSIELHQQGAGIRAISKQPERWGGAVTRILQARSKIS